MQKESEEWISQAEAARRLKLTHAAIGRAIHVGTLPATLIAGRKVLRAADVAAYKPGRSGRPVEPNSRRSQAAQRKLKKLSEAS